ncbi:UNKNOWN [Stylonychia lemnae]|uniref:Uncharacterized protein n=1 Tax=Stylonychia lemnae TaxID=5949 RepID=A0A078AX39_STYLE|nr:UNKNOWN [Stylonychia lemnae]|eukprot:CDW86734.1 UNKNOWN [Stylonychia lemnae]
MNYNNINSDKQEANSLNYNSLNEFDSLSKEEQALKLKEKLLRDLGYVQDTEDLTQQHLGLDQGPMNIGSPDGQVKPTKNTMKFAPKLPQTKGNSTIRNNNPNLSRAHHQALSKQLSQTQQEEELKETQRIVKKYSSKKQESSNGGDTEMSNMEGQLQQQLTSQAIEHRLARAMNSVSDSNIENNSQRFISKSGDNSSLINGPCIVRVKRKRDADQLDQIYLEFDQKGTLKRSKLVTEAEIIERQLSKFKLGNQYTTSQSDNKDQFSLGKQNKFVQDKDNEESSMKQVTLRRLRLPGTVSKRDNENEIKEYCMNIMNMRRNQQRQQMLNQKRTTEDGRVESQNNDTIQNRQLKILELITDSQHQDEESKEMDMQATSQQKKGVTDENESDYDYFLAEDLPLTEQDKPKRVEDDRSDQDSHDSNREDHSQNDYPDERSSYDDSQNEDNDYEQELKQYSYKVQNGTKPRKSSDMIDEEEAASKYNQKQSKQLKNGIFDKLMRKDKNWSHANKMAIDITQNATLEMYEPEVVDSEDNDDDVDMY